MGVNKIYNVIKAIKPQVKKTGTKEVVEHFKKVVTGLNLNQKPKYTNQLLLLM